MMKKERTAAEELREGWEYCVANRDGNVFSRQRLNYEARYCIWPNQSLDGRKWKAARGKEIFPWPGASDARVPLVDLYIREDVAALLTAWRRMGTQVCGVESGDAGFGKRLQDLLRWQKYTQMKEFRTELRLFASYGLERGASVMKVFWAEERQMVYETVDLEKLALLLASQDLGSGISDRGSSNLGSGIWDRGSEEGGGPRGATDPTDPGMGLALIQNEATEKEAVDWLLGTLSEFLEGATRASVLGLVRGLRTSGEGRVCVSRTVVARPRVKALLLNEEVFLPPEATEIGDEVYERELVTETTLRERVGTLGWDADWVDQMIESQRGVMSGNLGSGIADLGTNRTQRAGGINTTSRLFEVIHGYRRVANGDGVPELRYTVFNSNLLREKGRSQGSRGLSPSRLLPRGSVAYDGPLNYEGARGLNEVFVLWEWEKHGRLIDEGRGYGELAGTMQAQIKTEWDSRVDRASMATLPPLEHPPGQEPDRWGPGTRWPVRRRGEVGFAEVPKYDPGSKEIEVTTQAFSDRTFGRPVLGVVTAEGVALKQDLVDTFLEKCGEVDTAILKLDQQFLPDEFYYRVVGSRNVKPLHATRAEIQGQFDVIVGYNVEMMDPNTKKERLGLMEQALAMDVNGIVDRDAAIAAAFDMIDPNMGERLLRPGEEAAQREIEDEQGVFAKMFAGVPVDVKPGQAYGLRLQTLEGILMKSPPAQERYMSDENFRKLVDWRRQQLGFQLEQRQNALIGRLGGQSGYDQFTK